MVKLNNQNSKVNNQEGFNIILDYVLIPLYV
jgi:hypothetical protein